MGRCAVDGTTRYLRVSHVSARITSAGFCGGGGLYVRVAGIRFFDGVNKYEILIYQANNA